MKIFNGMGIGDNLKKDKDAGLKAVYYKQRQDLLQDMRQKIENFAKKDSTKKAATKTTTTKKTVNPTVVVQFAGQEVSMDTVIENAKKAFEAEGNKVSSIKEIQIYVKPEEYAAYYVINGEFTGRVYLF